MVRLSGVSAFPITPTSADGVVDVSALRRLLGRLIAAKVDSIGLLGSTGSYAYLTRTERLRAIETAADQVADTTPILVGVGALRTDEAVRLAQDARGAGATVGLLAPVSYLPLNDDEVFEHFATVARESQLPLCIYNNASTTHFTFSQVLLGRIAHLPGIVAVKNPAPVSDVAMHLATMRRTVPDGFSVGYSVDLNAAEAMIAGGDAWYSVVAGLFPQKIMAIVEAVQRKDADTARQLNTNLQPLLNLFKEFTSFRVVYAAANILGLCRAEPPRPILPLNDAAHRKIAETIERLRLG